MSETLDLFSLINDPSFVSSSNPLPRQEKPKVQGWIKTYVGPSLSGGKLTELPTLNFIENDGHRYRECLFELSAGVTVGEYAGNLGLRGLCVKGEKEMVSMYDGCQRELAKPIV